MPFYVPMWVVFCASPDLARQEMREACFGYLCLGDEKLLCTCTNMIDLWLCGKCLCFKNKLD
ncbi:putative squalene monooxygenase [Rosa chinensis]|uniref:Putative squalene monooxygenase n=1 Tax=Rosa chinensis TaxID=74649 RepID=A0A2P6SCX0_ROSCH|nr:putative squalene monooxygenase [Rosa chinensis]